MTPSASKILAVLLEEGPTRVLPLMRKTGLRKTQVYVGIRFLESAGRIEPHAFGMPIRPTEKFPAQTGNFIRTKGCCESCNGPLIGNVKRTCRFCSNAFRTDLLALRAGIDLYRRSALCGSPLSPTTIAIRLDWPAYSHVDKDGIERPGMVDAIIGSGEMDEAALETWRAARDENRRGRKISLKRAANPDERE